MAILFYADHTYEKFTHVQKIIDDFMERTWEEHAEAAWLEIQSNQMKSDDIPWTHAGLISGLEKNEQPDPEHYQTEFWSYKTMAMYQAFSDVHRMHNAAPNKWCPKVKGDTLVYRICVCDWDGSQYKCEDEMDSERIIKLLNDSVNEHPGFR